MVADGLGSGEQTFADVDIEVRDLGVLPKKRVLRALVGNWRALRGVSGLRAKIVHFHDPELIPACMAMKLKGVRVIYDVHEDVPRSIRDKHWIPRALRGVIASAVEGVEWLAARLFDALVCATPRIAERFPSAKTTIVQNFPDIGEAGEGPGTAATPPAFVYVGALSETRGVFQMLDALAAVEGDVALDIAGSFRPASLQDALQDHPQWARVRFHGWLDRSGVSELLQNATAGLVLLHPTQAYKEAYPVKMFEYMAAGLPVIASDFPLWRSIVEGAGAGLLVDPMDTRAIGQAMQTLLDKSQLAREMGNAGRQAVHETYNWSREDEKLMGLYRRLMKSIGALV